MTGSERVAIAFAVAHTLFDAAKWIYGDKEEQFIAAASDYARHTRDGETAYADLDALELAINMMQLTGRYESAYLVLDILLE